jgi:hypothetical protein
VHEERFPPPRLSARCRFSQGTFAGMRGNGRDAPLAAIRRNEDKTTGPTDSGHSSRYEERPDRQSVLVPAPHGMIRPEGRSR